MRFFAGLCLFDLQKLYEHRAWHRSRIRVYFVVCQKKELASELAIWDNLLSFDNAVVSARHQEFKIS